MEKHFKREQQALLKFIEKRMELEQPSVGDSDFFEVVKAYAYACRKFELMAEGLKDMAINMVVEKDQHIIEAVIQNTITSAFQLADEESSFDDTQSYVPLGFSYVEGEESDPN